MSAFKENLVSILGLNELRSYTTLLAQLFAEFLGAFLFLSINLCAGTDFTTGLVSAAFASGLLVASIIQIIGHVSGGHFNPALTVGVMVFGEIKILRGLMYVAVQIVGAIAGAFVAYALTESSNQGDFGVISPNKLLKTEQVFFLEFLQTFTLVSVFCSVTDTKRGARGLGSAALAVGLTVTACQCSCLPYTSCLNPVRALGPALVMNLWTLHWVYWVAPIFGGMFAGLVYKFLLVRRHVFTE
ncbi:hypothetical protein K1T71_008112 [Dendrolimus kikuchii]|uniref:Uncharacterized protein n=1 Tax=Dendrolimus kikuchii TaxID=765133 RepID=A0ACC1CWB1_9NEOP|nr:hypothetical protein K1T71_008112 [Dendrolimus kikuchii]